MASFLLDRHASWRRRDLQTEADLAREEATRPGEDDPVAAALDEVADRGVVAQRRRLDAGAGAERELEPLEVAIERDDVVEAPAPEVAVRRRAEAEVVALGPVVLVVAALVARACPVRHLVPAVAGGGEDLVEALVALGEDVVVGVARRVARERRPRLHAQGVRAQVGRSRVGVEEEVERALEVLGALAGPAVDEVDAEGGEARRADEGARRERAFRPPAPPAAGEDVGDEGLDAEGHPRHAGGVQRLEEGRVDVLGVALDGHLGARRRRDGGEDLGEAGRAEQGRRAAPDVRGGGPAEQAGGARAGDLAAHRAHVVIHEVGAVGPGGEGAVVAARRAERDVDVGAQAGAGHRRLRRAPQEAEALEAADHLLGRVAERGADDAQVLAADGQDLPVEVLALELDRGEEALERGGLRPDGAAQRGEVDAHALARGARARALLAGAGRGVAGGDVAGEELVDGDLVEVGEALEARHGDRPLAALVGAEHGSLELLARGDLDGLEGEVLLAAHGAKARPDRRRVPRLEVVPFLGHGASCAGPLGDGSRRVPRASRVAAQRPATPSTRRGMPSGFASWRAGGRRASGTSWKATGRRKRSIAAVPTEVCDGEVVAG